MGYRIEEPLFITAESVGASHKRERVFVLAHDASFGRRTRGAESARFERRAVAGDASGSDVDDDSSARNRWLPKSSQRNNATDAHWNGGTARADSQVRELRGQIQGMERIGQPMPVMPARKHTNEMAVAKRTRRKTAGSRRSLDAGSEFESGRGGMADANVTRPQERPGERRDAGEEREAVERDCVDIFAPGPNADWRGIEPHLWPAIEPGFRVLLDGNALVVDASRADQLRCAGNAVVPLCASLALIHLVRMSGILNGVGRGETKKARRV